MGLFPTLSMKAQEIQNKGHLGGPLLGPRLAHFMGQSFSGQPPFYTIACPSVLNERLVARRNKYTHDSHNRLISVKFYYTWKNFRSWEDSGIITNLITKWQTLCKIWLGWPKQLERFVCICVVDIYKCDCFMCVCKRGRECNVYAYMSAWENICACVW